MNRQIIGLLEQKGYNVHQTDNRILLRRKVLTHWRGILALFIPGCVMVILGFALKSAPSAWLSIFLFGSGIVLMFAPFLNYLTSSYRSLSIDLVNQTLLFRSSFARAYRFSDIHEFNLEIVDDVDSVFSPKVKGQDYTLSLHFTNKAKEELLNITIHDDESEQVVFRLKDYFEVMFAIKR